MDIQKARDIIAKSERWNLDDKLEAAFDLPLGQIFWTLHKADVLDCSEQWSWWNKMCDETDHYDAADVVELLQKVAARPDMAGLVERFGRSELAWNIYCRLFVENTISDAATLIAGYHSVREPMKSAWGLELAAAGVMDRSELPDDLLQRVARTVVTEVGGQRWYRLVAKVYEPHEYAAILLDASGAPDTKIWNLEFLQTCAEHATPAQWAALTFNIDYDSTVAEMIAQLDAHPDGVREALEARIGQPAMDYGLATACTWVGTRAIAAGEQLGEPWQAAFLEVADSYRQAKEFPPAFAAIDATARETLLLGKLGGWSTPWALIATTPTEAMAKAVVAQIVGFKQRDLNRFPEPLPGALAAQAAAFPEPFRDALAGKKVPARELLARALVDTGDAASIDVLVKLLGDTKETVREAALDGLVARRAEAALTKACKARKASVKDAGTRGLARLSGPVAGAAIDPDALRETVSEEQQEQFDDLWRRRRWREWTPEHTVDQLAEAFGDDLRLVVYDGLYRARGTTTWKLAVWHGVLERCPADADTAVFAVEMLAGWPLVVESGYDDTPAAHHAAVEDGWKRLDRFGDHVVAPITAVLDAAEASGLDAAFQYALDHGWSGLPDRVHSLAKEPVGATRRLVMALDHLGDDAVPGLTAALADKKADVRLAAAAAVEQRPSAALLELVRRKDRAGKVRDQLARAGFACASVDAPALADDPDLDARLAAWPGDPPKKVDPKTLSASWDDGTSVSPGALQWIVGRLGHESPEVADADLAAVCRRLDRASASTLLATLQKASKDRWTIFAMGHLGTDADMQALGGSLDDEARGGSSAQAFYKLEALRRHGGPAAITWVDHWKRNARSQGLQARAEQALEQAADARQTTPDALVDEICDDFGLDSTGGRPFTYGSTTVTLQLTADGAFRYVKADGKTVKSLPKAKAGDDKAQVAAAKKELTALKKQLKAALHAATERLEQAMVSGRRWDADGFARTWGGNALLTVLSRTVWWAGFDGDTVIPLRWDDGLTDVDGNAWDWRAPIGVVHPLELADPSALPDLGGPFRQLDRPSYGLDDDEADERQITRFDDASIGTGRLRGLLEKRRWRRGEPQDGGGVSWYTKHFARADLTCELHLEPGFAIGGWDYGPSEQAIPRIAFEHGRYGREGLPYGSRGLKLGDVDPIVLSEVLGDIAALTVV